MMQKNESEKGSTSQLDHAFTSQNQSGKRHDRADQKDVAIPFKKRARFLASDDIKEVSRVDTNTSTNKDKQIMSSTSGHADAPKGSKTEIVPKEKSTTHDKDAVSATLSLLAMRKSRGIATSSVKKVSMCMKTYTRDKSSVKDVVSRKIHIGDGSGPQSQARGDDGAPGGVGDAKQGKQVEYIISTMVHDGKTRGVGEQGKQAHVADPKAGGSSSRLPAVEKDGGIREGDDDDDYEEGEVREGDEEIQAGIMEDGDDRSKSHRCKKPLDIDINVYEGKQAQEAELVTNVASSSRLQSPLHTVIDHKNDQNSKGGFQEQVVGVKDVGGDENNNRNSERVDDGVSSMVHDGHEQMHVADPVTNLEERNGNNLEDIHEMEQQITMDDAGVGSSGIKTTAGDKKGKRPIEYYVASPFTQAGASGSGGKEPESNNNNAPIGRSDTDRERLELVLAELLTTPVPISKELESLSNAPHFVGEEGGALGSPSTNLTLGISSNSIRQRNHDDHMQQAAPQVSQQRPGCDGGFGSSRWVRSANDHRLRLFGIDINHVEEHEEVKVMQQQQQKPTVVLRLLGFDLEVLEEELQASATATEITELSMQQPKYGLRLMGFDL